MSDAWLAALRDHDARVAQLSPEIWIGGEPTFSRRESTEACWTFAAVGGDKEEKARELLLALAPRLASRFELGRGPGRQYGSEPEPRFAYAMRWERRDSGGGADTAELGLSKELSPPKPGRDVAWMTVTPDPGVVEVNLAPSPTLQDYWRALDATYAAAAEVGLSPFRYLFNGRLVDSGGGGQLSLGGPTPEASPFFRAPWLLPGLVRYLNRHPCLSYWFAPECLGSASQGPRPDEGVRELFRELGVALEVLREREASLSPEELMATLGPLLVDCSGNSHRAELNVEKLWNAEHPRGGLLGVAELRALRMSPTPEHATAVAALFRAIAARIVASRFEEPLLHWGEALHERFALPSVLQEDLESVLMDLEAHGFGLAAPLVERLREPRPVLGHWSLGGASITLTRALEFWPLVGDVASQEGSTSRTVDASTDCIEVCVDAGSVSAAGRALPLHRVGERLVGGVRYRSYVPGKGLHPGLPAMEPLTLDWSHGGESLRVSLYAWVPDGGAYDGLPFDEAEAARRRAERLVEAPGKTQRLDLAPPAAADWVLDLRRP